MEDERKLLPHGRGRTEKYGLTRAGLAGGIHHRWRSIVVDGLQMASLLEGATATQFISSALSLPVGHLVVEEAWECLLCFGA